MILMIRQSKIVHLVLIFMMTIIVLMNVKIARGLDKNAVIVATVMTLMLLVSVVKEMVSLRKIFAVVVLLILLIPRILPSQTPVTIRLKLVQRRSCVAILPVLLFAILTIQPLLPVIAAIIQTLNLQTIQTPQIHLMTQAG